MVPFELPRYTSFKRLASGKTAFYWTCPTAYRKAGCPFLSAALGTNLSPQELADAAAIWNERLEDWRKRRSGAEESAPSRYGTIDWLADAYQKHDSFRERVSEFSRPDYRRVLDRVCDLEITGDRKQVARVGALKINQIGVSTAERIYHAFSDMARPGHPRRWSPIARRCGSGCARTIPIFSERTRRTRGKA